MRKKWLIMKQTLLMKQKLTFQYFSILTNHYEFTRELIYINLEIFMTVHYDLIAQRKKKETIEGY